MGFNSAFKGLMSCSGSKLCETSLWLCVLRF